MVLGISVGLGARIGCAPAALAGAGTTQTDQGYNMNTLISKWLLLTAGCFLSHGVLANTCYRVTGEVWSNQYAEVIQQLEPLSSCDGKPCGKTYYPVFQNGQPTQYQVLDNEKVTSVFYEQIDSDNGRPVIIKYTQLSLCRTLITPCYIAGPSAWCFLDRFSTTFDADAQSWHWEIDGTSWWASTATPSIEINSLQFRPGTYTLRVRSSYVCQGNSYQSKWQTRSIRVLSKVDPECDHGAPRKTGGGTDRMTLLDADGNVVRAAGQNQTTDDDDGAGTDRMNLVTKMGGSEVVVVAQTTDNDSGGGTDRMTLLDADGNVIKGKHASDGSSDITALAARHFSTVLEGGEPAWFTNPHAYVLPIVFAMTDETGDAFYQSFELAPGATQAHHPGEAVAFYEVLAMQDFLVGVGDEQSPVVVEPPSIAHETYEIRLKAGREVLVGIDADGNHHYPLWQVEFK